ncbi:hypothetical protein Ahy_A01g000508 isoform B [Arachis hypogaea]|uniref:Importin N-terminal domain-containing protein n=1 Tax=Arachis hypogaea TaxID=3818 RepID=A0A445EKC9_ARAHY|nr:hypothetical protein Ahy_A01g000508 isoform B [Arachis hypogaea]
MAELTQIADLLNQTLSPDANAVRAATDALDRLCLTSNFPFYLLSISTRGEDQGQKVAAATYLKISRAGTWIAVARPRFLVSARSSRSS